MIMPDSDNFPATGDDHVVPFTIEGLDVRGRIVKLGALLNRILDRHDYPDPVAHLLAEVMVLTLLLGSALKLSGKCTIQIRSTSAVNLLVCDFSNSADLRAYARFDAQAVKQAVVAGKAMPQDLLGQGTLVLTVDQGKDAQPYQGIVALDGQSIAEIACNYFIHSEQIPTLIKLAVAQMHHRDENGTRRKSWRAGGYMAQFLPNRHADELLQMGEGWREAEALSATIEDLELTDPDLPAEHLLYRLFHEQGVRVFAPLTIFDRCSCSRDKIHALLSGFSTEELAQTIEGGKITVSCEFCSSSYQFDPQIFLS